MEHVISPDGTRIAFSRGGAGPALLLVHGAVADHTTTWRLVLPQLQKHFTVCAMDRRGRGASGDGPSYALAREAEDVAAVIDRLAEPVHVFGHSFGALCALEAARLCKGIARLVLYEGVPLRGAGLYPQEVIDRIESLVAGGDAEGALVALLRDLVQMPEADIDLMRAQSTAWQRRITNTLMLPRELRTEVSYVFEPQRFASMNADTVLLVGEDSPPRELTNARGVAAGLSTARVAVLAGQQHAAMHTAPDLFVAELLRLLG